MSWNSPAQWLLLHLMCAVKSYCLWQGYYPRRVMIIDTMSCCLPATCSAFFLTDSCMLEIQLFWVNSSCQETKQQRSNFAKAFSCFSVPVCFVLFCFSLKELAGIGSTWFGQHKLYWPAAAFAGCLVIREARRRWTSRGNAGEVLGDEQDSKDVGDMLAEGVMCKGKVFSRGVALWRNDLVYVWGLAERNSGRAWKKEWWIGNGWEAWAGSWYQSCFGNCCDCKHLPRAWYLPQCGLWVDEVGHEERELEKQQEG